MKNMMFQVTNILSCNARRTCLCVSCEGRNTLVQQLQEECPQRSVSSSASWNSRDISVIGTWKREMCCIEDLPIEMRPVPRRLDGDEYIV